MRRDQASPEGAWQREAFSAPASFPAGSAGDELWVGVALSRVSWPGCSSRLTAASRRVPESSAGCGEVRAPEPPPASQRTAGGGAGRPRTLQAETAGPRLPPGPARRPGSVRPRYLSPSPGRAALDPASPRGAGYHHRLLRFTDTPVFARCPVSSVPLKR